MLGGASTIKAIIDYKNNKFVISDILDTGNNKNEVVGKYFNELSKEMQNQIMTYSLSISFCDEISEDEIAELFNHANAYNIKL